MERTLQLSPMVEVVWANDSLLPHKSSLAQETVRMKRACERIFGERTCWCANGLWWINERTNESANGWTNENANEITNETMDEDIDQKVAHVNDRAMTARVGTGGEPTLSGIPN